ncbi:MAG: hypothetical protein OXM01_09820 [Gemmatimonadota bacterium]|nr:hypothetical protein [Gemmatimonadota bacterium]
MTPQQRILLEKIRDSINEALEEEEADREDDPELDELLRAVREDLGRKDQIIDLLKVILDLAKIIIK